MTYLSLITKRQKEISGNIARSFLHMSFYTRIATHIKDPKLQLQQDI